LIEEATALNDATYGQWQAGSSQIVYEKNKIPGFVESYKEE
jgi:hypothetical protein